MNDDVTESVSGNDVVADVPAQDDVLSDVLEPGMADVQAEDVPDIVKTFLDAVDAIPEITPENVLEASEYVYGEVSETYEALLGTEYETRADVQAAVPKYGAAIKKIDGMRGMSGSTLQVISGGDDIYENGIWIAPSSRPSDWTYSSIGKDGNLSNYAGTAVKHVGDLGFHKRLPINTHSCIYCRRVVAEDTAAYYTDFTVDIDLDGIIGNWSYSVGYWNNRDGYCLQSNYTCLKPGKTRPGGRA